MWKNRQTDKHNQ